MSFFQVFLIISIISSAVIRFSSSHNLNVTPTPSKNGLGVHYFKITVRLRNKVTFLENFRPKKSKGVPRDQESSELNDPHLDRESAPPVMRHIKRKKKEGLFAFFVNCVLVAVFAMFAQLNFFSGRFFVFSGSV